MASHLVPWLACKHSTWQSNFLYRFVRAQACDWRWRVLPPHYNCRAQTISLLAVWIFSFINCLRWHLYGTAALMTNMSLGLGHWRPLWFSSSITWLYVSFDADKIRTGSRDLAAHRFGRIYSVFLFHILIEPTICILGFDRRMKSWMYPYILENGNK